MTDGYNIDRFGEISAETEREILALGRRLWAAAEPGYFERRTHKQLADAFREIGFAVTEFEGMTGFLAEAARSVPSGQSRRILLIADMDGLPDPGTPMGPAAPEVVGSVNGATHVNGGSPSRYIHSCGHHMQMTVLYGAARILAESRSPVLADVAFCAVPAEEYIDRERRQTLVDKGLVRCLSGKQELLSRGFFKPFRYVVATHAAGVPDAATFTSVRAMNGFDSP